MIHICRTNGDRIQKRNKYKRRSLEAKKFELILKEAMHIILKKITRLWCKYIYFNCLAVY